MGTLVPAVTAAGGTLVGYSADGASTYVWLGQALLRRAEPAIEDMVATLYSRPGSGHATGPPVED